MYTAFTCFLKIPEIEFVTNQSLGMIHAKSEVRTFRDGSNTKSRNELGGRGIRGRSIAGG